MADVKARQDMSTCTRVDNPPFSPTTFKGRKTTSQPVAQVKTWCLFLKDIVILFIRLPINVSRRQLFRASGQWDYSRWSKGTKLQ